MIHLSQLIRTSLLFFLWLSVSAWGNEQADPWLMIDKAGQAAHRLNYKGVFVYQSGANVSSMQITHMNYGPNGEFARVVVLDGVPREMLRQGNDVVIYQPKSEKIMVDKRRLQSSFPAVLPKLSADIKANYQIHLGGAERVGGHEGQLVMLEPRDKYRYRCKIWIDRESGLLLKMAFLSDKDDVIEQVAFSQLMLVNTVDNDWFRPDVTRGKTYVMAPEETVTPASSQDEGWAVTHMPPGFRKTEQVRRNVPGKAFPVNHLVFWDGFASVSLFVEPVGHGGVLPMVGSFSQGATNVLVSVHDGHQIVVVGEVPPVTVTQISNGVTFRK
ncbi:MucB/RseB C-terminal domain-containing protein [Novimethylophilus sp.]|uniref:MucB/RseB C-terminal domain-containing protein n=1 Tax=Novimethylophilus sp. TaxID=2137426 RepID=UPI0039C9BD00